MKTNLLPLLLAACLHAAGQATIPIQLSSFKKVSSNYQRATARVNGKTSYSLSFRQAFTSLSIKMPVHSSLAGSYVVANGDTLRFNKSKNKNEPVSVSQLIIFKSPIKSFTFYSGALNEYVEFHLQNSGTTYTAAAKQVEPQPEALPMSQAIAAAYIPNEANLDRHQDLHSQAVLSRHPTNYLPKRKKN